MKIRPPHPTLMLFMMIVAVIAAQIFVPEKYNYYDWVGILWLGFWWLWLFPFLFIKVYDWATVRKIRRGGSGGASSPWLRIIGIMFLVSFLIILTIFFVIWLIGFLLSLNIR